MPRQRGRTQLEATPRGQASRWVSDGAPGTGTCTRKSQTAAARGPWACPRACRRGACSTGLSVLPHSSSGLLALWSKAWWGFWKSWSQGTVCTKQRWALRWMRASPLPSSRRERSPSQLMPSPCRVSEYAPLWEGEWCSNAGGQRTADPPPSARTAFAFLLSPAHAANSHGKVAAGVPRTGTPFSPLYTHPKLLPGLPGQLLSRQGPPPLVLTHAELGPGLLAGSGRR